MSQFLSGHGCFRYYSHKIKKIDDAVCIYCWEGEDTARHTFYMCPRWENERHRLMMNLGIHITSCNTVRVTLERATNWELVNNYIIGAMKQKEFDESRTELTPRNTI